MFFEQQKRGIQVDPGTAQSAGRLQPRNSDRVATISQQQLGQGGAFEVKIKGNSAQNEGHPSASNVSEPLGVIFGPSQNRGEYRTEGRWA